MTTRQPHVPDERGAIAIIVAVSAVVIFGLAAMVVDIGHARDLRRQAQNAADASALAAGNELYLGVSSLNPRFAEAVARAKEYARANYDVPLAAWDTCTDTGHLAYVPPASSECISFDDTAKPLEVRVRIPVESVNTPFASVLGISDIAVAARAKARLQPRTAPRCGLCVLGTGNHDLQNGDATVSGGDIHFNGSVSVSNNGLVATDGEITVQNAANGPLANYDPDPTPGQPKIDDPLADLPLPPDMSGLQVKANPCADGPGIYGAQNLRNATCDLDPGLYVVAGGSSTTWDLAGNSETRLIGSDVTLYFTCGSPSAPTPCTNTTGAWLDSSGNGFIGITAPTAGPLRGLAIIYDRGNTSTLKLSGNGSQGMTGAIYAVAGKLQMNGNGCSTTYNSLIVINDLEMNGNPSCLLSSYDGSHLVELPPNLLHLSE